MDNKEKEAKWYVLNVQSGYEAVAKQNLEVVIKNKGKGINDLSARVAMTAINELLALKDKTTATVVLDETINSDAEKEVQDTARSVKALMSFSA